MENHPNYLEYLRMNGGWFKIWTRDCKPRLVGYVSKVSPCTFSESEQFFITPLVFSYLTKEFFTNVRYMYEEERNFLGKPSIEDIKLIEDKLNKEHKKFNVKAKNIAAL